MVFFRLKSCRRVINKQVLFVLIILPLMLVSCNFILFSRSNHAIVVDTVKHALTTTVIHTTPAPEEPPPLPVQVRRCPPTVDALAIQDVSMDASFTKRKIPRVLVWGMLFDCEEWMLEIKLNEVGHVIDHFVIVEGGFSLQNAPREQCFPQIMARNGRISKWGSKIKYIHDVQPIKGFKFWEAEVYYRDQIGVQGLNTLPDLKPDDLFIVSDMDELLTSNFLYQLKWHDGFSTIIEVRLMWSYYAFFWRNPVTTTARLISSVGELRELGHNRTNALRHNSYGSKSVWRPQTIVGWHCSWCMPTRQFLSKMQNFAHAKYNTQRNRNLTFLLHMRAGGLWFPDQQPNGCTPSNVQAPEYARLNALRFSEIV